MFFSPNIYIRRVQQCCLYKMFFIIQYNLEAQPQIALCGYLV